MTQNGGSGETDAKLKNTRPGDIIRHRDWEYRVLTITRTKRLVNLTLETLEDDPAQRATLIGLPASRIRLHRPSTAENRHGLSENTATSTAEGGHP